MIPLSSYERLQADDGRAVSPLPLTRRQALRAGVFSVLCAPLAAAEPPASGITFGRMRQGIALEGVRYDGTAPLSCRVRCTPVRSKGEQTLLGDAHDAGFALQLRDGFAEFACHDGAQYVRCRSDAPLREGEAVEIVAVCDGLHLFLLLNGTLQRHRPAWKGKYKASPLPLFLGADPDAAGLPQHGFVGTVHEVRMSAAVRLDRRGRPSFPEKADRHDMLLWNGETDARGALMDASPARRRFPTGAAGE